MSRKHYVKIASAINELNPNQSYTKNQIARYLANALRGTNPNFNPDRFIAACLKD